MRTLHWMKALEYTESPPNLSQQKSGSCLRYLSGCALSWAGKIIVEEQLTWHKTQVATSNNASVRVSKLKRILPQPLLLSCIQRNPGRIEGGTGVDWREGRGETLFDLNFQSFNKMRNQKQTEKPLNECSILVWGKEGKKGCRLRCDEERR